MSSSDHSSSTSELLAYCDDVYRTVPERLSWYAKTFPTLKFYGEFLTNVWRSSRMAQRGQYDAVMWSRSSCEVLRSLESVGVSFEISGMSHVRDLTTPCVFVANHMSMLETIVLPAILQPALDITFVVKRSLIDYPVFRHILRSRGPIAVSRDQPREDFKVVMKEGCAKLERGISVVVFPQTTRSSTFDPDQFNSIGVKLACRAKVPVVPIALQTDAWGNGKRLKDFGPIDPQKVVRFHFGEPIQTEGRGEAQQNAIVEFIHSNLRRWQSLDEPENQSV